MATQRFFTEFDRAQTTITLNDPGIISQIRRVLRLKTGDQIVLVDGQGHEAVCDITRMEREAIRVEVTELRQVETEPEHHVTLYCAILKKEHFELVAQKATETGVSEIVPVITRRTIKLDIRQERVNKIIQEAAEQSGRGVVPALHAPLVFSDAIKRAKQDASVIFFDASGTPFNSTALTNTSTSIFIGPEGGWEEDELDAAETHAFTLASLGPRTLRAETAAIIASYLVAQSASN